MLTAAPRPRCEPQGQPNTGSIPNGDRDCIPETGLASPWLRESCHAIVAKSKAPGVRFRSLAVAKSLKWEAGTRADQRPERPDPLRDFEFSHPPFSNFRRCAALFYKKESRCAGQNPRFEALPSDHFCRNFCFFKRSQKSNVFPKGEKTGPKKRLFRGVSPP